MLPSERDVDRSLTDQSAGAPDERRADLVEPLHLAVVAPVRRHVVALGERRGDVQGPGDGLGRAGHPACGREDVAGPDEGLRRNAAPVRAFAAHELALDERDGEPARGAAADGVLTGRPASDDDDVVGVAHRSSLANRGLVPSRSVTAVRWSRSWAGSVQPSRSP